MISSVVGGNGAQKLHFSKPRRKIGAGATEDQRSCYIRAMVQHLVRESSMITETLRERETIVLSFKRFVAEEELVAANPNTML
jgi:hypothetical protein